MPAPTLTPEQREKAREAMVAVMRKSGTNCDWRAFAHQHGVPLATVYRWRAEIHKSGVAAQARLRKERTKAKRQVREAAKLYGDTAAEMKRLEKLADELPQVPSGRSGLGLDVAELGRRLESCATDADKLIDYAQREGQIRNPRIFHQGAELKRRVAETVPRVLSFLWDAHQAERTIKIMFEVIGEAQPEVARRIIDKLRAANKAMGLF